MISQKFQFFVIVLFVAALFAGHVPGACGAEAAGRVVTYSAPLGEAGGGDFEIIAGRQKVDTYTARVLDAPFAGKQFDYGGNYAFANFDMAGRVTVRIRCRRSLKDVVIRPQTPPVAHRVVDDNTIELTLEGPRKLSIEPDGKKAPLLLFANPLEAGRPKQGDPGVIYYGPGVHKPGKISLASGQTLYLAGGAVVKAEVLAQGDNIRILGRGILDGSDWEWRRGPVGYLVSIRGCKNFEISGVTLRGSPH